MVSGREAETARSREKPGWPAWRKKVGGDAAVHGSPRLARQEVGISFLPSAGVPGLLGDPGGPGTLTAGRADAVGDHRLEALPRLRETQAQRAKGRVWKRTGSPGRGTAAVASRLGCESSRSAAADAPAGTGQRSSGAAVQRRVRLPNSAQRSRSRCGISKPRRRVAEAMSAARAECGAAGPRAGPPLAMVLAKRRAQTVRKPRPHRPRPGAELRSRAQNRAPEPEEPGTALSCGAAPRSPRTRGIGPGPELSCGAAPWNRGNQARSPRTGEPGPGPGPTQAGRPEVWAAPRPTPRSRAGPRPSQWVS